MALIHATDATLTDMDKKELGDSYGSHEYDMAFHKT